MTVQCTVSSGDMPVKIIWDSNSEPIRDGSGVLLTAVGKRSSSLSIESVSGENAGNYTCRAKNRAGYVEYTATLLVNSTVFVYFCF